MGKDRQGFVRFHNASSQSVSVVFVCVCESVCRCVCVSQFWVVGFNSHSNISVDQSNWAFHLKNFLMCLYVRVSVHTDLLSHPLVLCLSLSHPAQVRSLTTENDLIQLSKAKLEDELSRQVLHTMKHIHTHTHTQTHKQTPDMHNTHTAAHTQQTHFGITINTATKHVRTAAVCLCVWWDHSS